SWRRSEWPTITYWQPTSRSIAGATSPVKAPPSSQKQSCAASAMLDPSSRRPTGWSAVNGGATAMSTSRTVPSWLRSSPQSASASATVLWSFQLPQTKRRLAMSLLQRRDPGQLLALEELERRAAAGRDVGHSLGDPGGVHRGHRVSAADDRG